MSHWITSFAYATEENQNRIEYTMWIFLWNVYSPMLLLLFPNLVNNVTTRNILLKTVRQNDITRLAFTLANENALKQQTRPLFAVYQHKLKTTDPSLSFRKIRVRTRSMIFGAFSTPKLPAWERRALGQTKVGACANTSEEIFVENKKKKKREKNNGSKFGLKRT